jgi:hypothetical protein
VSASLALVFTWSALEGAFTPWERLPVLPEQPRHIVAGDGGTVYVEGESGSIWACITFQDNQCWIAADSIVLFPEPVSGACRPLSFPLLPTTRPPTNYLDCLTVMVVYEEAIGRAAYALTSDGAVWKWENIFGVFDYIDLVTRPTLACAIGLLVAFFIVVIQAMRGSLRYRRRLQRKL